MEKKVCNNCWHFTPAPITHKPYDDSGSSEGSPCCELHDNFLAVTPDNTCKNWKSNKESLISVIKVLYGI
ncbi:MAG: hypothetical protein JRF45_04310 [Deltaproteobacteria bacterium]|nr:hypothetical protein [Deltaproteobacteria bacterium]MDX2497282.1 hypothetical protein [Desulfobacterales bacterium]MBW1746982.1 hypothetical protein [Deltaproteobacteria bacterium]MBW1825474.1 hypothetical protein [Deltaproteobacteria bacterium]MBW1968219.1 hypothetical protein [Deltaproteobacteria bacterium]